MEYLNLYLRDGRLAPELYGRLLWCIHGLRDRGHDIRADFPHIQYHGLGYHLRAFGCHDDLIRLSEMAVPLEELDLVHFGQIELTPETTAWAVSYRRSQGDSRRYSPSRARRLARRARERGESMPQQRLNAQGGIQPGVRKGNPSHIVWMKSASSPHDRQFSIAIARQAVPGPHALPKDRDYWAGTGYGLGFVVPDFSPAPNRRC